jgi:phage tail-like protein
MTATDAMREGTQPAFRYVIKVANVAYGAFTEATVPVIEWEFEEVKEGGLNDYVHRLPGRQKPSTVTLKNGVGSADLVSWYLANLSGPVTRKSITLELVKPDASPIITYHIEEAWPYKWSGPQLKSGDGSGIAIQTVDFYCNKVIVTMG